MKNSKFRTLNLNGFCVPIIDNIMSLHQPTPFEFKNGKLVDAFGEQIRFRNKENLKVIAEFMNPDTNPDVGEKQDKLDRIYAYIDIGTYNFLKDVGLGGD